MPARNHHLFGDFMKGIVSAFASLALLGSAFAAQAQNQLTGAFVHPGYSSTDEVITSAQWPVFLDELQDLGNDTVIVTPTRVTKGGLEVCANSTADFEWVKGFPSKLGVILDAAQARGMKVMVGTHLTCTSFSGSGNTAAVEADIAQSFASVASSYGTHPAFYGWYIPDEPGPVPAEMYDYYRRVTTKLKALLPNKPVAVAPYMSAQPPSPATLASSAEAFRIATGVNLQIWQDGIGANTGAKLFNWSRPGYTTEQYYEALAAKLGASGLWADIEIFNHGSPLFVNTGSGLSGAYRSASAQRVNQQLWSARSAGKKVSWLNQWHMSELIGPSRGYVEAPRLMGTYRAFYGLGATLTFPLNYSAYTWSTVPASAYPDTTGYELFDRRTGDPRNPQDPAWIGFNGAARVTIDLGTTKRIDWIGVHTLTFPSWGIRTPVSMDIYCGASTSTLVKIATATAPFTQAGLGGSTEEEYVLGNRSALGASCRYLDLRFPNGYWTFISEVEASAE
jgi:hypothetical protein